MGRGGSAVGWACVLRAWGDGLRGVSGNVGCVVFVVVVALGGSVGLCGRLRDLVM